MNVKEYIYTNKYCIMQNILYIYIVKSVCRDIVISVQYIRIYTMYIYYQYITIYTVTVYTFD